MSVTQGSEEEDEKERGGRVDPDHPASVEQCDHLRCDRPSPDGTRLCEDCVPVMLVTEPDECPICGVTVRD